MIFFVTVILAAFLYIRNEKVPALILFFFMLTAGFNLIPQEMTESFLFSKGMDYAIVLLSIIVAIDAFCIKGYLKPDRLILLYLLFCTFLAACILYNRLETGVAWDEIIRTCRYHSLWIAYPVFRNLSKTRLENLLKCLFITTLICSLLYLLQIFLNQSILNESAQSSVKLFGVKFQRYYNQPDMLHFFAILAIYNNPFRGTAKHITTALLIIALLAAFHRSLICSFLIAITLGYIIQQPRLQKIKLLTIASIASLFIAVFAGYTFVHSRTYTDIQHVVSGDITSLQSDAEELQSSTFSFRILHLMERNQYLLDNPAAIFLGAGLMTEDSKMTYSLFDFDVGLIEEVTEQTAQLDTGDISYSVLLLRYGYLGTLLILTLFIYLTIFFYKRKDDRYALSTFLFLIMSFGTSFFSINLVMPITFVLPLITYAIVKKNNKPPTPENQPPLKE
jgi:hypothetical protein